MITSDDGGASWTHRADYPGMHGRVFAAGSSVYVLAHHNDLFVMRSDDAGATWSEPSTLTAGDSWQGSGANVWYANDCVYVAMEKRLGPRVPPGL